MGNYAANYSANYVNLTSTYESLKIIIRGCPDRESNLNGTFSYHKQNPKYTCPSNYFKLKCSSQW